VKKRFPQASLLPVEMPAERERAEQWRPPVLPDLSGFEEIFFDFETDGLEWWKGAKPIGVSIYLPQVSEGYYVPWAHRGGGNLPEAQCREWFTRELRGKRLININTRFDAHMARAWGVDLETLGCTLADVGHYAALLDDHRTSFSLESISQELLGVGKIQGLDKTRMVDYHAGSVAEYAIQDARLVAACYALQRAAMTEQGLDQVRQLEEDLIPVVVEMERNGAPLDLEMLHLWIAETQRELEEAIYEVNRHTGVSLRPKAAGDWARVFQARGVPILHRTSGGQMSTKEEHLKPACLESNDPILKLAWRARKLSDLRSKFFLPWANVAGDGILRYALHQLRTDNGDGDEESTSGTVSGRFSSSGKDITGYVFGVNIQQVSKPAKQKKKYGPGYIVRELIVPPKGRRWIAADAKQIEYRLFAHYAGDPRILEAYRKDPLTDYHDLVWEMTKAIDPEIIRDEAKNVNFALVYGAGRGKVASMLGKTQEASDAFVAKYHGLFPSVSKLLNQASDRAKTRGYVHTMLGRRARFKSEWIDAVSKAGRPYKRQVLTPGEHSALNRVIQGTAADINKRELIEVHRAIRRQDLDMCLRFTVHDEVDGDGPAEKGAAEETLKKLAEVLNTQYYPTRVPILWDVADGESWGKCK
jgi:DNA polymerase I